LNHLLIFITFSSS